PSLSVSSAAEAVRADAAVRQAMASAATRRRFRVLIVLLRDDTPGHEKFGSAAADFGQVVQQFAQMAAHCGLGQRGVVITQAVHEFGVLADKLLYVEGSCRDVAQPVHLGFEALKHLPHRLLSDGDGQQAMKTVVKAYEG